MAKMYGVEIKSINKFMGHEGECIQGTVYYKGKKLGFWSQDSWGGPDRFDFKESEIDDAVKKYKESLPKDFAFLKFIDAGIFLDEVAQLTEIEKKFKKWSKDGYHTVIKVSNECCYTLGACNYEDDAQINKYIKKLIGKMKNPTITFYKSLDDFIVE